MEKRELVKCSKNANSADLRRSQREIIKVTMNTICEQIVFAPNAVIIPFEVTSGFGAYARRFFLKQLIKTKKARRWNCHLEQKVAGLRMIQWIREHPDFCDT